ncbi:MAG: hypothetical protein LBB75_05100 [Oscillospiraceae bacterium]|jgi:N-acetylglucosamine kinase-like BadF-type ATPase|nr:hypothetical protein [Oscillospiraceae bacterium]
MQYYLGIDGGGSTTRAVLADARGEAAATARAGSLNYRAAGLEIARESLRSVMRQVAPAPPGPAGQTPLERGAIRAAFIGNAALAGPAPEDELRALCEGILEPECLAMDSDVFIALEAMDTKGPCAVAIAGTGSMAAGRAGEGGHVLTMGGWGWLLGDEGSGFHVAWEGMRAGLRGLEGSGPATALSEALCRFFGVRLTYPQELIGLFYDPPKEPREVAAFAREVLGCDDAVARGIVSRCAADFAGTVRALLRNLPEKTELGLWGGMFQRSEAYRAAFCAALGKEANLLPAAPEWGAARAAMKLCGGNI